MSSSDSLAADVDERADTILRVCSYRREDFDRVTVYFPPEETQPVQSSLQSAFETLPTAGVGGLERVPAELISMILRELDVHSFRFRQVNRQARIISTGLLEYRLVSRYCLQAVRALLHTQLAPFFTISDLYRTLTTDKCSTCGGFGGHMFLLTAEKCCFDCLVSSNNYRVFSPSTFAKLANIPLSRLGPRSGQRLRAVPGVYDTVMVSEDRPSYLISEKKATQTLFATVIPEETIRQLRSYVGQPEQRFMVATAYPYYDLGNAILERGVSCKGCRRRKERRRNLLPRDSRDKVFSTHGFLSHFSQCRKAQRLWTKSEKGERRVREPRVSRGAGYCSRLDETGLPRCHI
ncbi:hypothetical protein F5Y01DRAFT_268811 [Xylaria sp. FL0043]|nr:hypothetical protein F5Y01DRAFT_268811 [Xylaria sp. FL0043]